MEKTPKLSLGPSELWNLDLTVVITTTITCILVFIIAVLAARSHSLVPKGMQNLVEMIIEFTQGIVRSNLHGKIGERFYGFAFTLFLFIFIANQLGLMFNVVTEHHEPVPALGIEAADHGGHAAEGKEEHNAYAWWKSPTADINVPIAMAFAITIVAHFLGIRKSPKKYASHYFQPFWWMFPLHIIDEIAKPMTHGMRLWANIFAGEVLIIVMLKGSVFLTGAPLLVWLGYSVFVGTIQAYVFTVLAMVYMSQKLSTDH
ncbi:F0F1 ATP synthase subunit A [Lihuaxuella thermophila]|uniref:ATP synthase subunit a n=1 Tax=Lihuaxuella thermophila TaxID=1173111 RepID=A0A1H8BDP4_9BACL|nr:F0F1 ATP synthase subunit A [Lihuaxuella thermophila]SEM79957.1 F-type H+-transporting ATPase subunit a [Lihuaxuella thermophila]